MVKQNVQDLTKSATESLTKGGLAATAAIQELTTAYQDLAARNVKTLQAAISALTAVKTPSDFVELQQKLLKEGVEAAVEDSQHIAKLTTAVFTAAFEPVKQQIAAAQKTVTA